MDPRRSSAVASGRSLLSRATTLAKGGDGGTDIGKGPLGLTTVYDPGAAVCADLIFVHGLGGGSRKTWTKNEDPALFWPQQWLSVDSEFQDVRIHTFGYDSNWEKESVLNIHDFAKSLLEWIKNCPCIPRDSKASIVFVCHSLGGLVAKRAYILSRQLPEYDSIAQRVRTIFFLATPHRGSNLAELLSRILQVTSGSRQFVAELHPNSTTIEAINDEFPHHCKDLQLFSFYETMAMNLGIKKSIVVPKDSATLGYSNERTTYLNANHREVCKFIDRDDRNYISVRNTLASAIDALRRTSLLQRRETDYEQQQLLNNYLEVNDAPDDDLLRVDSLRMPGSCVWIAEAPAYQHWREATKHQLFWLAAKPGTGKSVLSGYVIRHLKDFSQSCSFYFAGYADKQKSSIGLLLRSLAWQMASSSDKVLQALVKVCKKEPHLAKSDYRTIWRKLFLEVIFTALPKRSHYWVIDAIDEFKSDADLVPLLLKAAETGLVQIFVTSRNAFEFYGTTPPSIVEILSESIPQDSTKADIRTYLAAHVKSLPALGLDKEEARETIMQAVVDKSSGCFLWVRLVLHELRRVHTAAEIRTVLESVPSDMDELYMRILDSMSELQYGKELAKAILTWTACSFRPLSTTELYDALQLDIEDRIDSVLRSIESSCGQLVYVDATARVQMVHETARKFLLKDTNRSEFAIERRTGHKRLAMVCLRYLTGSEMSGPKPRKLSATTVPKERSSFVNYASTCLWDHVLFVSSQDDEFLMALGRFLNSSNVLSWIEYIARNSDLSWLIRSGKSLRNYLSRRSRHLIPLGKEPALLDAWAVDLVRLVTKFGKNLTSAPSSIFQLIPPFCPSSSALKKQFGSSTRSIAVYGLSNTTWDDCSSTITAREDVTSAVACSDKAIAVGLASGRIGLFDATTCQELGFFLHGETVKLLQFGSSGTLLASAGLSTISVWDVNSNERQLQLDTPSLCMSLVFKDNDQLLLGAFKTNEVSIWDLRTGWDRESLSWLEEFDEESVNNYRRPMAVSLSVSSSLLAVVYRGQDVIVWDIDNESLHDIYSQHGGSLGVSARRRPGSATARGVVFSQSSEPGLLAASFNDGELVVFNTSEGGQSAIQARAPANALCLASSPDGMTLACGNSEGTIQLFDFDTLKLLYRIQSEEYGIKSLAFSHDSLRLVDIRGPHCRVWDPPVLMRSDLDEGNSDTVSISTAAQDYTLDDGKKVIEITTLTCTETGEAVFCGKADGSVCVYDGKTGKEVSLLFRHTAGVSVVSLCFDAQSRILCTADSSSRIMAYLLIYDVNGWSAGIRFYDHRAGVAVEQILINISGTRLLVSSSELDTLWALDASESYIVATKSWPKRRRYRYMTCTTGLDQLMLIKNNVAHVFEWQTLEELTNPKGIALMGSALPELAIKSMVPCFNNRYIATTFAESLTTRSRSKLMLWDARDFEASADSAAPVPHYQPLADHVEHLVGTHGQRLIFLLQDGWICSADSSSFDIDSIDRHFFFPTDWLSGTNALILDLFRNGNIVFVHRDEMAVVRRGLEHYDAGQPRGMGKRPSLARSTLSGSTTSSALSESTIDSRRTSVTLR